MSNRVSIVMNGKGGINKTGAAVALVQHEIYKLQREAGMTTDLEVKTTFKDFIGEVLVINLDTENNTIGQYRSLKVIDINILARQTTGELDIDKSNLDALVDQLANETRPVVIDVGTSAFRPFLAHLQAYNVLGLLAELGKEVTVHAIVGGGQHLDDTIQGAIGIDEAAHGTGAKIVVWNNQFFGETLFSITDENGKKQYVPDQNGENVEDILENCIGSLKLSKAKAADQLKLDTHVFQARRLLLDVDAASECGQIVKIVVNRYYNEIFTGLAAISA
jgi:hypothetical protein